MSDNLKKLYDTLSKDGYDTRDFESFSSNLQQPDKLKKMYDILAEDNYDVGDFGEFSSKLISFAPRQDVMIPETTAVAPSVNLVPDQDILIKENNKPFADEAFENQLDQSIHDNKKAKDASMYKNGVIDYVRKGAAVALGPVTQAANSLYEYYAQESPEYRDRKTAEKYLSDAKDLQSMSKAETEQSDWQRLFSSFGREATDENTLSFGLTGIDDDARMISISNKMEKEGYDNLSKSEQDLLQAATVKFAAQNYYGSDIGIAQQAGQATAASIPYMLQFLATGGIGAAATSGVKKAAMGVAKRMLKKGRNKTVAKIGTGIVTNAAKAAAMTPLQPAMYSDITERMSGHALYDEIEGKGVQFSGIGDQAGIGEAIVKGFGSTAISNFSEMSGELLGGIGKIASKYGKKIPKVGGLIDKAEKNEILTGFNEFGKKIGWNGTIGEFFEEQTETVLNSLAIGDSELSDLVDKKQQLATLVSISAMGGFFTGVNAGGGAMAKRGIIKRYEESADNLYDVLESAGATEQDVLNLENQVVNNTNEQNQALLTGMVESGAFEQNQFDAICKYVTRATEYNSMIGGVKDQINEEVEVENEKIRKSVNPDMNAIVIAKLDDTDNEFRVTGGNLVPLEDGSIDIENSSETIYIETDEGVKPYYVGNIASISSVIPLEDALISNEQQIKEVMSQQMASEINDEPVAEYQEGDLVMHNGKEGIIQSFTPEGNPVVVYNDGSGSSDPSISEISPFVQNESTPSSEDSLNKDTPPDNKSDDTSSQTEDAPVNTEQFEIEKDLIATKQSDGSFSLNKEFVKSDIDKGSKLVDRLNKDYEDDGLSFELIELPKVNESNRFERKRWGIIAKDGIQSPTEIVVESSKVLDELPENEVVSPVEESNVIDNKPNENLNDKEYAEWALDESENTDELLGAYNTAKELSNVENKLLPWQQELLGKKISPDSFYRFGDRNTINGGFARSWLKKDGYSIDTYADELSELGVQVTPQDIVDFMQSNPTNYARKTSDLQTSLSKKWSEAATNEAGVPISGPESATGKVFIAMKKKGETIPLVEYKNALQEDTIQRDESEIDSGLGSWYEELTQKANVEKQNAEDVWTKEDYNDIYETIDNELNGQNRSGNTDKTGQDTLFGEDFIRNEQSDGASDAPGQNIEPEREDRKIGGISKSPTAQDRSVIEAEAQVDTTPSEAQKKAGNYKKGHVRVSGFDVTIEQPVGSVRSGKDASGKEWSVTMQNTYGYLPKTEGVDGDHIDVFLGGNLESKNVFVVDQVNKDGSFDEHKVMVGFDTEEEARSAYLANYEEGWQGMGGITSVSLDEFKKWKDGSIRKTKPFASYKQFIDFTPVELLTMEDLDSFTGDELQKRMAKGYLDGKQNTINTLAYENIKNKINERDRSRLLQPDSGGTAAQNEVNAEIVSSQSGRDGRSGGRYQRKTDKGEQGAIQFDNEESGSPLSGSAGSVSGNGGNAGRGSHFTIQEESSGDVDTYTVDSQSRRGSDVRQSGHTDGRGRNKTDQNAARNVGKGRDNLSDLKKEKDDALNDLKKALKELRDAGKETLSISVVGLNPRQIEATMKVISSGARYGYALVKEGVVKLSEWMESMKGALSPSFKSMNFSDKEIETFISDMWEAEVPNENGVYKSIRQWAEELGMPRTKEIVRSSLEKKRERQIQAESVSTEVGSLSNIRESLPFLLPEQHEDVQKAEARFFSEAHHTRELAYGKGMMFTNGTGTGKTYVGLGVIKRMVKQGKKDILIVVPSQNKVKDWIKDGENLGLYISALKNTKSAGKGVVITTYANFGINKALHEREFDLVVYDESHRLMENKDGGASSRTSQHYLISNRNDQDALRRLQKKHPLWIQEDGLYKELAQVTTPQGKDQVNEKEKLELKLKEIRGKQKNVLPELEAKSKKASEKTKVLFLSATPFKDHFNLRYVEQYLFSYPEKEKHGYNDTNPEGLFYLENFGAAYRMRYNRLEKSGENADLVARQEIEFSQKLTNLGVMSGRMINSEMDYSRDFPTVTGFNSEVFNNALNDVFNYKEDAVFESLRESFSKVFHDYNYSTKLFEVLKTSASIERMKKHLDEGRKIVVFHRRRQGDARPPFHMALGNALTFAQGIDEKQENGKEKKAKMFSEIESFKKKYGSLLEYELGFNYLPVPEQLREVFGDRVAILNGDISTKDKLQAVDNFNSDNSGVDLIVIQEESGKEGISLHDQTGAHPRVLMNMALPISSITALQIEGRTYRIGNATNAIFEYPLLGLDLETYHFGSKLNKKLSTTENLAMGNLARDLLSSFANGVLEQRGDIDTNSQGAGGKEYDKRASAKEASLFDKAVSAYYNTIKRTAKTKSREGIDYFPTPEPIGLKMVEWGMSRENESFLEPSAGHGAIARWVPTVNKLTAIEPSGDLFSKLNVSAGGGSKNILQERFEDYHIVNKHDVIVMNPPFGINSKTAADHLEKSFIHLRNGGRVVAVVPDGNSMNKRLEKILYGVDEKGKPINPSLVLRSEILLPSVAFERAGTSAVGKILVIDKIEGEKSEIEDAKRIDLRYVGDIRSLFEAIREVNVPSRIEIKKDDISLGVTGESTAFAEDGYLPKIQEFKGDNVFSGIESITHTKTGEDLFVIKLKKKLDRNKFVLSGRAAKLHNGYWSGFLNGFIFKIKEDAEAFRNEIASENSEIRYRQDNDADEQFNQELDVYQSGRMNANDVFHLGAPSGVLKMFLPELGIVMRQKIVTKGVSKKHNVDLNSIRNMPSLIKDPIFIFQRSENTIGILTEIRDKDSKNVCVAIEMNKSIQDGKTILEVNNVNTFHGREPFNIVDPIINNNTLKWVDKEKGLDWISSAQLNGQEISNQDLVSATNVIKNFENPTRKQGEIMSEIENISSYLNTKVKIIKDVGEIKEDNPSREKRKRNSKGWYDPKTGEVFIVLPNAKSLADAQATILHEVVGHKGLRGLLAERFDPMMYKIFSGLPKEIKDALSREAIENYSGDIRVSTEEYLARLAEADVAPSLWEKVKNLIKDFFRSIGIDLKMSDSDIRHLLWKSKNRIMKGDSLETAVEKVNREANLLDSILFREDIPTVLSTPVDIDEHSKNMFNKEVMSSAFKFQEGYQDRMLSVKKLIEAIEKAKGGKLPEFQNAYLFENTLSSRSHVETVRFEEEKFKPILNAVGVLMKKNSLVNIYNYMMIRSGLERNIAFAKRDASAWEKDQISKLDKKLANYEKLLLDIKNQAQKKLEINLKKDYAGITAIKEELGDMDLNYFVEKFEKDNDVTELWRAINDATGETLKKWYKTGMMDRATYEYTRDMLKFYLPLRGFEEITAEDVFEYSTPKDGFNSPMKKAKGRTTKADNPLAYIASMAEAAIIAGNKNLMKQHLLEMVRNNPSSLYTLSEVWYENKGTVEKPEWKEVAPEFNLNPEKFEENIRDHEARMKELSEKGYAVKSKKGLNIGMIIQPAHAKEHEIKVYSNGVPYVIYMNTSPAVANAINGLNNPDATNNTFVKGINWANRQMAANVTMRNPAFVLSNLSRDLIYSNASLFIKEGAVYRKRFGKNTFKSSGAIFRFLRGELDMNNKVDRLFKEFIDNGGETGYTAVHNVDEYKKLISKELKKINGEIDPIKAFRVLSAAFGACNRWAEDLTRFSTYMTSRQEGRSITRSIVDAKEVTVNFNRKGSGAMGAIGFKSLYMFFNTSVQGLDNFAGLVKKYPKRALPVIGMFAAIGYMMPFINSILIGGLNGDEDDYNNLSDWVRQNNIVIHIYKGRFLYIPLPIELRAFYGTGEMIHQWAAGRMKDKNITLEALAKFSELLPLDPAGIANNFTALAPSSLQPIAQSIANVDFTGKPLFKDTEWNKFIPKWRKAYAGTNKDIVLMTEKLNELSGGDYATKGKIDWNPAIIEHLIEQYTGGVGKIINQGGKTIASVFEKMTGGDDEILLRNIPVVNRFVGETSEYGGSSRINERYFHNINFMKEMESRDTEYKNSFKKLGDRYAPAYNKFISSKDYMKYRIIKMYSDQVNEMNKIIQQLDEKEAKNLKGQMTEQKQRMLEEIDSL